MVQSVAVFYNGGLAVVTYIHSGMATNDVSPSGVGAQLQKILSSAAFGTANQSSRLLRYVVERTLDGREDEIKESILGVEVFGRNSFDPRTDPIVRVEASRLRQKLKNYYESEGSRDAVRIVLPKRGYVPVFEHAAADIAEHTLTPNSPANAAPFWGKIVWLVAGLLLLSTVALATAYWRQSSRTGELVKLSVLPPPKGFGGAPANISPDGKMLVFSAPKETGEMLWIRPLNSLEARPIPGTEDPRYPFWSPDSRSVGFFNRTSMMRVELASGTLQVICDAPRGMGGTWNREDVIIFAPEPLGRLYRVPATGGTPEPVTDLNRSLRESSHRYPFFLPDGEHFLYSVQSRERAHNAVYLSRLGNHDRIRMVSTPANAVWARFPAVGKLSGERVCVVFYREGSLFAQRVDPGRFQLIGEPIQIAGPIGYGLSNKHADFSVSDNGILVYSHQPGAGEVLTWLDRSGKPIGVIDNPANLYKQHLLFIHPALSPDGKTLAAGVLDPDVGHYSVWLIDLKSGTPSRFTFEASRWPVWSRDGKQIAFNLDRTGSDDLFVKPSDDSSGERLLLTNGMRKIPSDWSGDGQRLLFDQDDPKTKRDLWILPSGGGKAYPILQTPSSEYAARFSPDGRWIAYTSDESGQDEVYVQSFPLTGAKRKISHHGGSYPEWRRDGKELFYVSGEGQMMSVLVDLATVTFHIPNTLFSVSTRGPLSGYSVTAEGQRFLMNLAVQRKSSEPITVMINWSTGIR